MDRSIYGCRFIRRWVWKKMTFCTSSEDLAFRRGKGWEISKDTEGQCHWNGWENKVNWLWKSCKECVNWTWKWFSLLSQDSCPIPWFPCSPRAAFTKDQLGTTSPPSSPTSLSLTLLTPCSNNSDNNSWNSSPSSTMELTISIQAISLMRIFPWLIRKNIFNKLDKLWWRISSRLIQREYGLCKAIFFLFYRMDVLLLVWILD